MTLHQAKEVALTSALLAVLLMLFEHLNYYLRHSTG